MKIFSMRPLLLAAVAAVCFAGTESGISDKAMTSMESSINDAFRTGTPDPYELLGTARGAYLPNYGAIFTVELQLVYTPTISPFRPAYTPAEVAALHDRKLKKLPVLKEAMRNLLVNAGTTLDSLPPGEQVAIEAILWHYNWEDGKNIPKRVLMFAQKDKLMQAQAAHASLASVIQEQELH
jgi:hypothetical protein